MSHFYSTCQGHRGQATRTGSKSSQTTAEAFGWDLGGRVVMRHNKQTGCDEVHLYTTRDNNSLSKLVASFTVIDGELKCLQTELPELLL